MIKEKFNDTELVFETSRELFSPNSLDIGSLALLKQVEFSKEDKLLDLGCGYGLIGIYAAKIMSVNNITMSDIDNVAIEYTKKNIEKNLLTDIQVIQSEGFSNIDTNDFTIITSNPPYHTDFSVAKHFIEKGFNHLAIGGKMYIVTKRKPWYKNKLIAIFGGVKIVEIDGYFVFLAIKKQSQYAKRKIRKKK